MNTKVEEFMRHELKQSLPMLSEGAQLLFKRGYSHDNLELPMDEIIDKIPKERLDGAMQVVERTIKKMGLV